MGHRYIRTPQHKAEQKARTEKNKLKPVKARKFASDRVKNLKLQKKEEKRNKFMLKNKG